MVLSSRRAVATAVLLSALLCPLVAAVHGQFVTECPDDVEPCSFCKDHEDACQYPGQYCPTSYAYPKKCEAKYYCPCLGKAYICPEGHFCREGSALPTPCQPLVICPEGSRSETKGFAGLLFNFLLVLVGYLAYQTYKYMRNKKRAQRAADTWVKNPLGDQQANFRDKSFRRVTSSFRPTPLDLGFKKLSYFLAGRSRPVLQRVSGQFLHGRLIAILGPSGAGKTTLLRVLSGRLSVKSSNVRGSILVNGVASSIMKYRTLVGYVPQDDVMLRDLSVKENIRFSALTRLPRQWTRRQKLDRANEVITMLELDDVRHSKVGDETRRGVSGGQRKRVNIGLELVANPSVLFLDEPTSGLDSAAARHTMKVLRQLADTGITVVCVVHQPRYEIFRMFDDMTLLARGGQLAYFGSRKEALPYFVKLGYKQPGSRINPADYFIDIVSGDIPGPGDPIDKGRRASFEILTDRHSFARESSRPQFKSISEGSEEHDIEAATLAAVDAVESRAAGNADGGSGVEMSTLGSSTGAGAGAGSGAGAAGADSTATTGKDAKQGDDTAAAAPADQPKPFFTTLPRLWHEHVKATVRRDAALASASSKSKRQSQVAQRGQTAMNVLRRASRVFVRAPVGVPASQAAGTGVALDPVVEAAAPPVMHERQMPGWFRQFFVFLVRSFTQQMVMITHLATDLFLVCAAGSVLGMVYFDSDLEEDLLQTISLSCLVVGMTAITSSQRWFSKEVAVFQREQYVGCSATAYFLAKCTAHIPLILLSPAVYLTFYYTFSSPRAPLYTYYGCFVLVELVGTGVGYMVPLLFKGRAQLAGVVFPLVCTMFSGVSPTIEKLDEMGPVGTLMYSISYARWATELLFLANANEMHAGLFKVDDTLSSLRYSKSHVVPGIIVLVGMALFFRLITFILLMRGKSSARRM